MYSLMFDRTFKNFLDDKSFYELDAEVREDDSSYEVLVDVPGVDKNDLDVSLDGRVLTITAKREKEEKSKYKSIFDKRWLGMGKVSFKVNTMVGENDISADLNYGVLKLKIPKNPSKKILIN